MTKDHRQARREAQREAAAMIRATHPEYSAGKVTDQARRLVDQTVSRVMKPSLA